MLNCPCDSQLLFSQCCGFYLQSNTPAPTPEALMRSRYTAYSMANIDYIERTMQGAASKGFDPIEAETWAKSVNWLGLEVIHSSAQESKGFVEFIASYRENQQIYYIHELSEFKKIGERWFYIAGKNKGKA